MTKARDLAVTLCAVVLALASAGAQAPRTATGAASGQPRTPWGAPDLQGRWTSATLTPIERPAEVGTKEFFTQTEATEYKKIALEVFLRQIGFVEEAAISGEFVEGLWMEDRTIVPTLRTSLIVGPSGRVPPFTPEAQKRAAARAAARKVDRKNVHRRGPDDVDGAVDRRGADAGDGRLAVRIRLPRGELRPRQHPQRGAFPGVPVPPVSPGQESGLRGLGAVPGLRA